MGVIFPGKIITKAYNVIIVMRGWVGVKFPGKIITKVYGLTLLARYHRYEGLGGCQISRKNHYKSVQRYYCYEGVGGCQISRKNHYKSVRFNVIIITRGWVGVKFPGKIITKVYGLTLLARYHRYEGLGGCQISRKNHYKSVQRYYCYEGVGGCQISRKNHYKKLRFNVIGTLLSLRGGQISRKNHYKNVRFNVIGTLLSLRGRGWVSNFQKKASQRCTVQRYCITRGWVGVNFP